MFWALVRSGGLAAIVGGTASAALGLLYVFQARGLALDFTEKGLQKGHYESPVLTMLLVGVLAAIFSLHLAQRRYYGGWGALGSFVAFAGVALVFGGNLLGAFVPSIASMAIIFLFAGILAMSVGIVILGIATMAAGRLPRWSGAAVIAGSPAFVFLGFMVANFVEMSLGSLSLPSEVPGGLGWGMLWVLAGAPWAVVGYALFRAGLHVPERFPRMRQRLGGE